MTLMARATACVVLSVFLPFMGAQSGGSSETGKRNNCWAKRRMIFQSEMTRERGRLEFGLGVDQ